MPLDRLLSGLNRGFWSRNSTQASGQRAEQPPGSLGGPQTTSFGWETPLLHTSNLDEVPYSTLPSASPIHGQIFDNTS